LHCSLERGARGGARESGGRRDLTIISKTKLSSSF
jgi:hypothetical protein